MSFLCTAKRKNPRLLADFTGTFRAGIGFTAIRPRPVPRDAHPRTRLRKHDCARGETDPGANHFARNPKRDVVFTRDDGVVSPSCFPVISRLDANPQRCRLRSSLFSAPLNPAGLGVRSVDGKRANGVLGDGQSRIREIVCHLPLLVAFRLDRNAAFFLTTTHRLPSTVMAIDLARRHIGSTAQFHDGPPSSLTVLLSRSSFTAFHIYEVKLTDIAPDRVRKDNETVKPYFYLQFYPFP